MAGPVTAVAPVESPSMLLAALAWAGRGIPVFPVHTTRDGGCSCGEADCASVAKHPRTSRGVKDATTDERQIREWWARWPDANIGGAVGEAGLVVVDVDGDAGRASLAAWEATHGELPDTLVVRTGGGGVHLWFRAPEGRNLRNRVGVLDHVDVRTRGGYCVLPPSSHASGRRYEALVDLEPDAPPAALLDLIDPPRPPAPPRREQPRGWDPDADRRRLRGFVEAACRRIEALQDGRREALLREAYRLGGYVPACGIDPAEVADALINAGHRSGTRHDPVRVVWDGLRDGMRDERPMPPDSPNWRANDWNTPPRIVAMPDDLPPEAPIEAYDDVPAPEGDGPIHATTPDGRPYLVKVPGSPVWFVATSDGFAAVDERLVRSELRRHWPDLKVSIPQAEGPPRPMNPPVLFERYGVRAEQVFYTYTGRTRFEYRPPHTGDLYIAVVTGARPAPVRHAEVLGWLEALAGPRFGVVCDWLACLPLLDRPTAALLLLGPKHLGKTMFATGCARYFGAAVADYDDVFKGRFNDALLRSPVVALEEGTQVDSRSAGFRKLVANRVHAVEGKNRPTATLLGCPRLVVTANNPDPLKLGREDLTAEDEDAIGERILIVDCSPDAHVWLVERGGAAFTSDWIERPDGTPGKLPETIAWLHATRAVDHGSRFLVAGDAAEWAARVGTRTGLPATILDAIAGYLATPAGQGVRRRLDDAGLVPFRFDAAYPDCVLVANDQLRAAWESLLGERPPTHRKVAEALGRLARDGNERLTLKNGERPRGYVIDRALVGRDDEDGQP